jgi:hypothetical protein
MNRQIGQVLVALAIIVTAATVAVGFLQRDGATNVILAAVFGFLLPAAIGHEWWLAKRRGDDGAMLAIERVAPFYALALMSGHM